MKLYAPVSPTDVRNGILVGTVATCGEDIDWDCIGNVSLVTDRKLLTSTLVAEIDPGSLTPSKLYVPKRGRGRVRYYDNIPPDAITKLILTTYIRDDKGKRHKVTKSGKLEDLIPYISQAQLNDMNIPD